MHIYNLCRLEAFQEVEKLHETICVKAKVQSSDWQSDKGVVFAYQDKKVD